MAISPAVKRRMGEARPARDRVEKLDRARTLDGDHVGFVRAVVDRHALGRAIAHPGEIGARLEALTTIHHRPGSL